MAQGWSQVWADLKASLRGGSSTADDGGSKAAEREEPALASQAQSLAPPKRDPSIPLVLAVSAVVCTIGISAAAWILIPYYLAPTKPPLSAVVATFDGGDVTLAQVEDHLAMLPPAQRQQTAQSPGQLLLMVEEMISDRLVLLWAAQRKPEKDESFQHAMQHADETLSLKTLSDQIKRQDIVVTESEIRLYYDANAATFQGRGYASVRDEIRNRLAEKKAPDYIATYLEGLRAGSSVERNFGLLDVPAPTEDDIVVAYRANPARYSLPRRAVVDEIEVPISVFGDAGQARASDMLLRIRGGATFQQVATANEGVLFTNRREAAEGESPAEWDANVFATTQGDLAGVFRAGEAYHVVRLVEIRPARLQSLEEVRRDVVAEVSRRNEERWFADNGAKTLFTLKGQRYSLADFYREYRELPEASRTRYAGPAGMKTLADSLIDRMLLVSDTYDKLVDVINEPVSEEARIGILKLMMEQEEIDDAIEVSEAEIEAFYTYNRMQLVNPAKARIRYIRIGLGTGTDENGNARARAQEAYSRLAAPMPASFADIAREYSEDPQSAANGGRLDEWVGENNNPFEDIATHPFHDAVLALEPGKVNEPFEASGNLYVVEVLEKVAARRISYKQARPMIREALLRSRHRELANQLRQRQIRQYDVRTFPEILSAYVATSGSADTTP